MKVPQTDPLIAGLATAAVGYYLGHPPSNSSSTYMAGSTAMTYRRRRGKGKISRYSKRPRVSLAPLRKLIRAEIESKHEVKTFPTGTSLYTVPSAPTVINSGLVVVSTMVPGAEATNRLARDVHYKGMDLRGILTGATSNEQDVVRVTVVIDKEAKGAAPSFADIFQITGAPDVVATFNMDNKHRFKICFDKVYNVVCTQGGLGAVDSTIYHFETYIPLNGYHATFYTAGTAGTIADCEQGSVWVVVCSVNGHADIAWQTQLYFRDP